MNKHTSGTIAFVGWVAIAAVWAGSLCRAQTYTITTVAGGAATSGTPARMTSLPGILGLAVDNSGNIYLSDGSANVIRKVTPGGAISVVAGDINSDGGGYYGDGKPAVGAGLNSPSSLAIDSAGNLYFVDAGNSRVRKVSTNGTISTVAGGGTSFNLGGQATQQFLLLGNGIAVDSAGDIFFSLVVGSGASGQVLKVAPNGILTSIAGSGNASGSPPYGDGGPAVSAFIAPIDLAVDSAGNVYLAETTNRIRKVSTSGMISTVAGSNTSNFSGDGGPAISAGLSFPQGVAVDAAGSIYIADSGDYRVRKVTPDGNITTIAGNGRPGVSGDGGPATSAGFANPQRIAVGSGGVVYVTDRTDVSALVRILTPVVSAPSISTGGIVPLSSTVGTIQPGEWVSIFGSNLANGTAVWNGDFPISLGGTSVTIDNKPAYLSYVSPGQVNLQAPDDTATGTVSVAVTTLGGTARSTVTLAQFGPSFSLLDGKHVAGIILRTDGSGAYGGGSYDIVGPTGTSLGYKTVAAKAGDVLELFGVGFGPTNPVVLAGKAYSGAAMTTNAVQLLINNIPVTPAFSGITSAGLYQFNIFPVPAGLGTGDVALEATVGGVRTPSGVFLSVQ